MTGKTSRRVPAEAAATPAQMTAAIEALTVADWGRLRRYGDYRILKLGPKADGQRSDDLLQTALLDLLEDRRRWDTDKIRFVPFLCGAMRSISSNWARGYEADESPALEADLRRENEEGEQFSPVDNVPVCRPNPEEGLEDTQTLAAIEQLFKSDEDALKVLVAWQEGYDPPGVRELWGLSQTQYNTIVRRIRRNIEAAGLTGRDGRGT
jgi:hypothetical protein